MRISHLSKRFALRRGWGETLRHPGRIRHTQVLRDVSFDVTPGELFGLLGPNGAGKTTLFKILSTLVTPDLGAVSIAGHDLLREPARVREVLTPVIADERSLNWRVPARENLRLYGALQGLRGRELGARIDAVLVSVGLDRGGATMAGQLSSGMKQRLLIARALMHRPRVLLLDEPTRSLDPITAREFRTLLREEVIGRQRCTVLLATHNPEEALSLCDRVAILDHGRLVTVESPVTLSSELVGDRYRVWTRTPDHPAFAALAREGTVRSIAMVSESASGAVLELCVAARGDDVADIVTALVMRGARVSRFEQSPCSLADLIERAIQSARRESRA